MHARSRAAAARLLLARARALSIALALLAACSAQSRAPRAAHDRPRPAGAAADAGDAASGALTALGPLGPAAQPDEPASYGGAYGGGACRPAFDPANACAVHPENIARTMTALLDAPARADAPFASRPWDRARDPAMMDRVERRFVLQPAERARLARDGFVVLDRLEFGTYARAYHEIFQSELPVYVTADSIFHAVFASHDRVLGEVEDAALAPLLGETLARVHGALPGAAPEYPAESAADVDLYLAVARSLLAGERVAPALAPRGEHRELDALLARVQAAEEVADVPLFGRARVVDFTQFTPRGHYAETDERQNYFRAAMWLARTEFNLVSRSCRSSHPGASPDPAETPREDLDALVLADLVARAGASDAVARMDRAWRAFAGRREDVSVADLAALRARAGITDLRAPDAAARLRAAIGQRFRRAARTHPMPDGAAELPAIATLLGPRVVPDTALTRALVHDEVPGRFLPGAADLAYALGHDRARRYLARDLAEHRELAAGLARARRALAEAPAPSDLYAHWFAAIRALSERPRGALPSFAATPAFADLRINSAVAAYGQLRHNYALMVSGGYDSLGCRIPDGYVEPVPAVYDALIAYAARARASAADLGLTDAHLAYFESLERTLRVLRRIVDDELAGRALTPSQRHFLGMVVEISPGGTEGCPPNHDGWYYALFPDTDTGNADADFVADYYTSRNAQAIAYVGARAPRVGLFVVDVGGEARVMAGPVAHAYEHHGPLARRLTDESARSVENISRRWAASYLIEAGPVPPLAVSEYVDDGSDAELAGPPEGTRRFVVRSTRAIGPVTLELLDHHRRPIGSVTRRVGRRAVAFDFRLPWREGDEDEGGAHRYIEVVRARGPGFWYENQGLLGTALGFRVGGMELMDGAGYEE